jgi:hypothetical protein
MKSLSTTGVLTLALVGAVGCTEEAGVVDENDRYTVPESVPYAAPSMRGQSTGVTGEPSGAGGMDLSGEARPGMWDASRAAEVEQPTRATSPYQNLPPGSVQQPQGGQLQQPAAPAQSQQPRTGATVQPQPGAAAQPAANPGQVPPTVNSGGNTAGTTTGR